MAPSQAGSVAWISPPVSLRPPADRQQHAGRGRPGQPVGRQPVRQPWPPHGPHHRRRADADRSAAVCSGTGGTGAPTPKCLQAKLFFHGLPAPTLVTPPMQGLNAMILGRFLAGVAIGVSSALVPTYISEVCVDRICRRHHNLRKFPTRWATQSCGNS